MFALFSPLLRLFTLFVIFMILPPPTLDDARDACPRRRHDYFPATYAYDYFRATPEPFTLMFDIWPPLR